MQQGGTLLLSLLLECKADVHAVNKYGRTREPCQVHEISSRQEPKYAVKGSR
jgi:hypothetical protein